MTAPRATRDQQAAIGSFAVILLWFGMLLGVSFLATPAKFLAPSLTMPVALDVGRHTFAVFNIAEWALIALLAALFGVVGRRPLPLAAAAIAALMTAVETVWLLPALDARVGVIMAGGRLIPSSLHNLYIAVELVKTAALVVAALAAVRWIVSPRAVAGRRPVPAADAPPAADRSCV
jgi:hypothetical protein